MAEDRHTLETVGIRFLMQINYPHIQEIIFERKWSETIK